MSIPKVVLRVAALLKQKDLKVVFAESCTGGLVSGALTRVSGISNHHCGGVVVYRNETKQAYLKIPATLLADPGPVSKAVARIMAISVLGLTPEADVSAAVTGHLGPNAPKDLDGVVYIAVMARKWRRRKRQRPAVKVLRYECQSSEKRLPRQKEVVEQVLACLEAVLAKM